jgi:alanyl-tRNA synthetase
MTQKLYLHAAAPLACEARITSIEPGPAPRVRVNRTVFHAKGGGQPPDRGQLGGCSVLDVRHSPEGEVDHFVDDAASLRVGDIVYLAADADTRLQHSLLHTAGHAIVGVLSEAFPMIRAVQGHHYPKESRVEFEGDASLVAPITDALQGMLAEAIRLSLPVAVVGDPDTNRTIQIGSFPALPCGGTHVTALARLGRVAINGVRVKAGRIRISYDVTPGSELYS